MAIDTEYLRPILDASHLIIEGGRGAFVDTGSNDSVPLLLDALGQHSLDPAEAVAGADLVVIGTPLGAYAEIAERIGPLLEPGAIVSDVGSVKQAVIRDVAPHLAEGESKHP